MPLALRQVGPQQDKWSIISSTRIIPRGMRKWRFEERIHWDLLRARAVRRRGHCFLARGTVVCGPNGRVGAVLPVFLPGPGAGDSAGAGGGIAGRRQGGGGESGGRGEPAKCFSERFRRSCEPHAHRRGDREGEIGREHAWTPV